MSELVARPACTFDADQARFFVPPAERGNVDALGGDRVRRIDLWLLIMGRVHCARNRKAAYDQLSASLGQGLEGFSAGTIKRTYLRFRASGFRWTTLLPEYHNPEGEARRSSLPKPFLAWWRTHALSFAGGTRAAHADLVQRWRKGEPIPGYGSWMEVWQREHEGRPLPAVCPHDLPAGWSYDTLLRKLPPTRAEVSIVREGFFRAMGDLPIMPRDRSQLRAFELIAFDDFQTDFRSTVPGIAQVVKARGLAAMAVSCGVVAHHEVGASVVDDEDIARTITRADMKGLLFTFLRKYGVPTDYQMVLLVENATAAITAEDEEFLAKISAGRIRVMRTAMHCRSLLAGGPAERLGSPQAKGWLESFFNLFHNHASALPGYAGSNPLTDKRGDIDGVEREALAVLKACQGLPTALIEQIATGIMPIGQVRTVVRDIINRLNHRTNHRLQGFELIPKWRLRGVAHDNPWRAIDTLPPHLESVAEIEHFVESPMERFERLLRLEKREPLHEASLLPLLDDKVQVSVTRPYQFIFRYRRVERCYTIDHPRFEKVGEQFTACLDPKNLDAIYLLDGAGAYAGTATLWTAPNPVDREQVAAAAEQAKRLQNRLIGRAQELAGPLAQARVQQLEQSNERLAEQVAELEANRLTLTPAEQAGADAIAPRPKRGASKREAATRSTLAGLAQEALNPSPSP